MNKRHIVASLSNIVFTLDKLNLFQEADAITKVMIKIADELREDNSPEPDSSSESFLDKMVVLPSYWVKNQKEYDEKQRLGDIFLEIGNDLFRQALSLRRFDKFEQTMESLKNEILNNANFTESQESDFLKYYEDFIESFWHNPRYAPQLEIIAKVDKYNPLFGSRKREIW